MIWRLWNKFWCWMGWHSLVARMVTERDMQPNLADVRAGRIYPSHHLPSFVTPGYCVHCKHCDHTVVVGAKGIR